jgi:hypothetical protein
MDDKNIITTTINCERSYCGVVHSILTKPFSISYNYIDNGISKFA